MNLDDLALRRKQVRAKYHEKKPIHFTTNIDKMELTQTYKNKVTLTALRTSFQAILSTFIDKHAGVFKALPRGGTLNGGNGLSSAAQPATYKSITSKEQIAVVQQLIDELNQTVIELGDQLNAQNVSSHEMHEPSGTTEEIGINRFRALQTES